MADKGNRLLLHLQEHCIETAARTEYKRRLAKMLGADTSEEEMQPFELLNQFLEETNFPKLRGERPELNGSKNITVSVQQHPQDGYTIEIVENSK